MYQGSVTDMTTGLEARQSQSINITALIDCITDIVTETCSEAVAGCIQDAISSSSK
jgi:hypothetical protein